MKEFINFIFSVLKSISYNGLFIILSILFPVLFISIDAGAELFLLLKDPYQFYNVGFVALAFHLLTLSMWCLPTLSINLFSFCTGSYTSENERIDLANRLKNRYSFVNDKKYVTSRHWAVLPWLIFNATMVWIYWGKWFALSGIFLFVLINILFRIRRNREKGERKKRHQFLIRNEIWVYVLLIVIYMIPLLMYRLFNWDDLSKIEKGYKWIEWFNICYFGFLMFFISYYTKLLADDWKMPKILEEMNYASEKQGTTSGKQYKKSKRRHLIVLLILNLLMFVVLYVLLNNNLLPLLSPIVVAVLISAFLIINFEFFFSSQFILSNIASYQKHQLRFNIFKLSAGIVLAVVVFTYLFASLNQSKIRTEYSEKVTNASCKQENIENYFENWYRQRLLDGTYNEEDSVTIYLVSGQGGGSRAAVWFIMSMLKAEEATKDIMFYKKIFSISSVSGSISGANMYMAAKHFHVFETLQDNDSLKINNFLKSIYGTNYMSSGIYGLFLSDYLIDGFGGTGRDRNYYFQNEEMNSFMNYLLKYETLKNEDKKNLVLRVKRYFLNDYLENYKPQYNYEFPLFFINAVEVENGTKAIFSPVINDLSVFQNTYKKYRDSSGNNYKALPLITSVNQGQAFPLINSYNFIPGVGRLGDGGFYENSGTETTLETYKKLIQIIDNEKNKGKYGKIRIACITVLNSPPKKEMQKQETKNSILSTLSFLTKNLDSREAAAKALLKNEINKRNQTKDNRYYIEVIPTKSYSLTRALSSQTIDSIFSEMYNAGSGENENTTRFTNALKNLLPVKKEPAAAKTTSDSSENLKIFIQYTDKTKDDASKIQDSLIKEMHITQYPMERINGNYGKFIRYFNKEDLKNVTKINKKFGNGFKIQYLGDKFPDIPTEQIEIWVGESE
jgi:hypothetical protein